MRIAPTHAATPLRLLVPLCRKPPTHTHSHIYTYIYGKAHPHVGADWEGAGAGGPRGSLIRPGAAPPARAVAPAPCCDCGRWASAHFRPPGCTPRCTMAGLHKRMGGAFEGKSAFFRFCVVAFGGMWWAGFSWKRRWKIVGLVGGRKFIKIGWTKKFFFCK